MVLIISVQIVCTFIAGVQGNKMFFNYTQIKTPCASDTRAWKDKYRFTGVIEANINQLGYNDSNNKILAQVLGSSYVFDVCQLSVRKTCSVLQLWRYWDCTCVITPQGAYFTIEHNLRGVSESFPLFRVIWQNNSMPFLSTENYTLPKIVDTNTALLTLTVGGSIDSVGAADECNFSITLNTSNALLLCCSEMAMPCYPQISFRGTVVANNESPCVTYVPTSNRMKGTLVLSYSVCVKDEYKAGRKCEKRVGIVSTKATTTTTSTSTSTTRKTKRPTRPTTTITTITTTTTEEEITDKVDTTTEEEITDYVDTTTDKETTEDMETTTESPKNVNTLRKEMLFWITAVLAVIAVILFVVTDKVISRKRRIDNRRESNDAASTASVTSPKNLQQPKEDLIKEEEVVSMSSATMESDVDTGLAS